MNFGDGPVNLDCWNLRH